jgi:hypothetical protein
VNEFIQNLENLEGNFSQNGTWKLKRKLMPRAVDPPMGKFDDQGNLITAPNALKKMYLNHYVQRLKHRQIGDTYQENYEKKVILWQLRFQYLKVTKSDNWSIKDLRTTLKSLKSNKTRDPSGLLNELIKPPVIGHDLEDALLQLVNGIQMEYIIPYTNKKDPDMTLKVIGEFLDYQFLRR